jgi:hypothetical protein
MFLFLLFSEIRLFGLSKLRINFQIMYHLHICRDLLGEGRLIIRFVCTQKNTIHRNVDISRAGIFSLLIDLNLCKLFLFGKE